MIKTMILSFSTILLIFSCIGNEQQRTHNKQYTNIVYILADDLGYGDLSILGQEKFLTPNLDALSESGMLFTNHYSGSTVCAPSRAVLMTGKHTGHVSIRGNREVQPEGQSPLISSEETIAEMVKAKGYKTGAFGKWGLGFPGSEGDPLNQGFDEFFGYNCQRLAHHYYPHHLWDNDSKLELKENEGQKKALYAPELIQQKTLAFIEKNKDVPFFLYVPHVIPHAELVAPEEYMEKYRGKYLPEKPYISGEDGENKRTGTYESQEEPHAAFVAMIHILDDHIGQIVNKLEELGIREQTLIVFTSDNGPHVEGGADPEYFQSSGPFSGVKRSMKDGGIRVPMIASWPGKIEPGTKSGHLSSFQDVKATVAELLEIEKRSADDGISFLATLLNSNEQEQHDHLYWEFGEVGQRIAIRKGKWKAIMNDIKSGNRDFELYNVENDVKEENDVAKNHPDLIRMFDSILVKEHIPHPIFKLAIDTMSVFLKDPKSN